MKILPSVQLENHPRMADWTVWGFAIAEALGFGGKRFVKYYKHNRKGQHWEILEDSPVGFGVHEYATSLEIPMKSTPTEFFEAVKWHMAEHHKEILKEKGWPKSLNVFMRKLRQVRHNLYKVGVLLEFGRGSERYVKITNLKKL